MNTARILSTATFAAAATLASFGAYAAPAMPAAGEFSAAPVITASSTVSRAEVSEQGAQAVANFKNFYVEPVAIQATVLTRVEVRNEARVAVRANEIATGNFS